MIIYAVFCVNPMQSFRVLPTSLLTSDGSPSGRGQMLQPPLKHNGQPTVVDIMPPGYVTGRGTSQEPVDSQKSVLLGSKSDVDGGAKGNVLVYFIH